MELTVSNLVRRFAGFTAVDGISVTVESGSCLALLGPSGCGKTTTLNMIAGFQRPDGGEIRLGGKSVVGTPPHKRSTGMVFQNYALFPHMTVFDNVAYGLRQRKTPQGQIQSAVAQALAQVRLGELGERYPRQLSGGQQQRVALARALVFGPELLLLDEPLSNLDAKLRDAMRVELKEIQKSSGVTTVFVTHDQAEAMSLADRIAVMNRGKIEQIGLPEEIYNRPATRFVADFVGSANFVGGRYRGDSGGYAVVEIDGPVDRPVLVATPGMALQNGAPIEFMVRPERLRIEHEPKHGDNALQCTVGAISYTGPHVDCFLHFADRQLQVQYTNGAHRLTAGQMVWLCWGPDDAFALPQVTP